MPSDLQPLTPSAAPALPWQPYRLELQEVLVPYYQLPVAQNIAQALLRAWLDGPSGVWDCWRRAQRGEAGAQQQWGRAAAAALDAVATAFGHAYRGLDEAQVRAARAGERLHLVPLDEWGEDCAPPWA